MEGKYTLDNDHAGCHALSFDAQTNNIGRDRFFAFLGTVLLSIRVSVTASHLVSRSATRQSGRDVNGSSLEYVPG